MFQIHPISGKVVQPYTKVNKTSEVNLSPLSGQQDSFEISSDAKILSSALYEAKALYQEQLDTMRLGKVNRLKQQMETGEYRVTSQDVAKKLLNLEEY